MDNNDFDIKNGVLVKYHGNDENIIIPDVVTEIGINAFYNCYNITTINIPNSVTRICDYAFYNCESLSSITIPNSVNEIGMETFAFCDKLKSIIIPNSVQYIGIGAFSMIKPIKRPQPIDGKLFAYKAFNSDWTCRDFQYEVGKSYHKDGTIKCRRNGFHAGLNPLCVFNYYYGKLTNLHFTEAELSGEMSFSDEYSELAASDIRIIRELTVSELAEIYTKMEKA